MLFAALSLAVNMASANADPVATLVDYLNGLDSFSATFVQTRYDEDGEQLEVARGDCRIKRPGRFRWTYAAPYPQVIVSDGATLWIHDQDLEQITRSAVATAGSGSPAALLGRETDVAAHYHVTLLEPSDAQRWFRLESKEPGSDFAAIELAFDAGEIRGMRLTDNLGQVTALEFADVVRNGTIADSVFEFTPPAGVDVIEGGMP